MKRTGWNRTSTGRYTRLFFIVCLLVAACSDPTSRLDPAAVKISVIGVDGMPVPEATVSLMIRPDADAADNSLPGDVVTSRLYAQATTDANGQVTVRLDPASVPAAAFSQGNGLNVTVLAVHEPTERLGTWNVPLMKPPNGQSFWTDSVGATEAPEITIELRR